MPALGDARRQHIAQTRRRSHQAGSCADRSYHKSVVEGFLCYKSAVTEGDRTLNKRIKRGERPSAGLVAAATADGHEEDGAANDEADPISGA